MRRIALVVVLTGLFALPVLGAATLASANGQVEIGGQLGTIVGTPPVTVSQFSGSVPRMDQGPFQQSLQNSILSSSYGTVNAMAAQVSSFSTATDGQLAGASFAGTAAISAATFAPMASAVKAGSLFSFTFLVTDQPVDYAIAGSLTPLGAPAGPSLQLLKLGNPVPTIVAQVASMTAATDNFNLSGTLQPGLYTLNASVGEDNMYTPPGVLARSYSMVYTFNVPEPMSLGLLALGGLAMWRRRR